MDKTYSEQVIDSFKVPYGETPIDTLGQDGETFQEKVESDIHSITEAASNLFLFLVEIKKLSPDFSSFVTSSNSISIFCFLRWFSNF